MLNPGARLCRGRLALENMDRVPERRIGCFHQSLRKCRMRMNGQCEIFNRSSHFNRQCAFGNQVRSFSTHDMNVAETLCDRIFMIFNGKKVLDGTLADIQSGKFAQEWVAEHAAGKPSFKKYRAEASAHQVEEVGAKLRTLMPWMESNQPAGAK